MEQKYEDLLEYYQELFPVEESRVDFIEALAREIPADHVPRLLELGCSAGTTALALARRGLELTGIDRSEDLIRSASRRGKGNNPRFFCMDMRDCHTYFPSASFDMILCLGDSLAYLDSQDEARTLFRHIYELLVPGGIFIFELVNYDKVLQGALKELPLLASPRVRYTRSYGKLFNSRIRYTASLRAFNGYPLFIEEHLLYPLRQSELAELLGETCFSGSALYQDFAKTPLCGESLKLVGSAQKR
jgi:SAM-dependent methyltransferase